MDFDPLDLHWLQAQDDDFLLFPSNPPNNEKVSPTTRWPKSARNAAYNARIQRRESCAIFNHLGEATDALLDIDSFIDEELLLPDDDPSIDEAVLKTPRGAADARDVAAAAAARKASVSTSTPLAKFSFPTSKDLYRTVLKPSKPFTFRDSLSKPKTDGISSEPLLGTAFSNRTCNSKAAVTRHCAFASVVIECSRSVKLSETSTKKKFANVSKETSTFEYPSRETSMLTMKTIENASKETSTLTMPLSNVTTIQESCVPETTSCLRSASSGSIIALDVANAAEPENVDAKQETPTSHMERSCSEHFLSKPDTPTRLRMPSKTQTAFRPLDMRPESQLQMRPTPVTHTHATCKPSPTSIPIPVIDKEKEISRILQTMGPLPTYNIGALNGVSRPTSRNPFISPAVTGMIPNSLNPRISRTTSLPRMVDIDSAVNPSGKPPNPTRLASAGNKSPKRKSSLPATRGGSGSAATSRIGAKVDNDSEDSDDEAVRTRMHDNGRVKMRGVVSGPGSGVTKLPVPRNLNRNALKLDMELLLQKKIPQPPRSRLKPPSISASGHLGIGSRLNPPVKSAPVKARRAGQLSSRSGPT